MFNILQPTLRTLNKNLANSRAQFMKRKAEVGTTSQKSTVKAYSNSPEGLKINYQRSHKQSLGFRRGSNVKNLKTGASTTKGKKKINFLNQKSTRENKEGRWSKIPLVNNNPNMKLDSTGGIGGAGDNISAKIKQKVKNRKLSSKGIRYHNASNRHEDSISSGYYGSGQLELSSIKKSKLLKNPVASIGKPQDNISTEENDILMTYLRNFIRSNKLKITTQREKDKNDVVEKLKKFLVYLEDKNLINSKIQDTQQLNNIVDNILATEAKTGHYFQNKRQSNP